MALLPATLDYTNRDFDSMRLRLQGLARTVFPEWTDFSEANFGNLLLEMMAFVSDVLNFYQDKQANELFWPTVKRRDSALRLASMIDYTLSGAASATGAVIFSLSSAATKKVIIPVGTPVSSTDPEDPVSFRTTAAGEIAIGTTSASVAIEEATTVSNEAFQSNDEPNQEMVLERTPYLDDTASVACTNGTYTQVANFLSSIATSKHFQVLVDEFDRAHVRFGNGVNGEIPQGQILISYKVGGGARGNVEANRITILQGSIYYEDSTTAPIAVTNPQATSGGADRESLAYARLAAPASLRTLNRSVSKEDFETAAEAYPGVARALMVTSNEYYGIEENTGKLYVVAQGTKLDSGYIEPAAPSTLMCSTIYSYIMANKPSTVTFSWEACQAVFLPITISTRIYLEYGTNATTVGDAIRAAIADFFAAQQDDGTPNASIDFGANLKDASNTIVGEIAWSDVFNVINDIDGVRKLDEGNSGLLLNGVRSSITLTPIQFPQFSAITIINADTELAI